MEILISAGVAAGLAAAAGMRAFLPLAVVALFAQLGLLGLHGAVEEYLGWGMVGGLAALAVLEVVLEKVRGLYRALNAVQVPVRAVSGAVLFYSVLDGALGWLVAGFFIAGAVALLRAWLRPPAAEAAAGVSPWFMSAAEDVVSLVGGVLAVFVPFVPLLLVAFLLLFFYRVRRRRSRKYGGLRILSD
ncbi:DUF4126 domain-containing protein [Rubrobacter xylanophilus]|uniref:DUF4126 domain-containing protein n=1 Tax=Rubrobacter xylanophilus TaxID=49319 RepID=UPI001C63D356|nr:DUF4126 domain-containing protein [Rubrobacter xylanophilus]